MEGSFELEDACRLSLLPWQWASERWDGADDRAYKEIRRRGLLEKGTDAT